MREDKENNLTIIEGVKSEELKCPCEVSSHQTNPIRKELMAFCKEKKEKFSVLDLFRK